ncbi:MAG: ATP synthase F1 subunit epsilon [Solobacterium sp.]|nr:ATP synthase F1 subunit epsilon [Solobacterium sp.]MBR2794606.1 ATP synthase F1 subunit epsilon [Solobacterium sp.]
MSEIHVRIITPLGLYKEFDTPYLNFQTTDGDRGILPNHMPLVSSLKIGKMSSEENGVRNLYAVSGGLLYFHRNVAEILTDSIENKNEIDAERAKSAKERAEDRLAGKYGNVDTRRAQLALARALNRLNVYELK